jgi:hypothetical protein
MIFFACALDKAGGRLAVPRPLMTCDTLRPGTAAGIILRGCGTSMHPEMRRPVIHYFPAIIQLEK